MTELSGLGAAQAHTSARRLRTAAAAYRTPATCDSDELGKTVAKATGYTVLRPQASKGPHSVFSLNYCLDLRPERDSNARPTA